MPDEAGRWSYETVCSDVKNEGLHGKKGTFHDMLLILEELIIVKDLKIRERRVLSSPK